MHQPQKPDYQQICRLQNLNYELTQQLEDLRAKYENLKKQQKILEEFHWHNMPSQQFSSRDNQELSLMKEQFVALVREKQQQQQCIRQLKEKVEDMKYTMHEMRQLSEKQERIHMREVELFEMQKNKYQIMLQDMMAESNQMSGHGNNYNNMNRENHPANLTNLNKLKATLKQVEKKLAEANLKIHSLSEELSQEKETNFKNLQKLQKCSEIAKQMEEYYTNQLQTKQLTISQLEIELSKYTYHQQSRQYCDLFSPHTKLPSIGPNEECSSLKCSSIVSEYHHQQMLMGNIDGPFFDQRQKEKAKERLEEKYKEIVDEVKESHAKEIQSYHEKIRYLTLKVQALQAQKAYLIKNRANISNLSDFSHSETFIIPDHMQSVQSLNHMNTQKSIKSFRNQGLQESVNLKMSKTSGNESLNQFTPKSEVGQSVVRESSQSHKCENQVSGTRPKLTAIKTPNKVVQKSLNLNGNRNFCGLQRVILGQSNINGG